MQLIRRMLLLAMLAMMAAAFAGQYCPRLSE
jgi:hypothetical protein